MTRLNTLFQQNRASQRKTLAAFITAGDPTPEATLTLMHALVSAGADIIELGVPFSDPAADGSIIQAAGDRALHNGTNMQTVLSTVASFRKTDNATPVVLMGYLNPIEIMGYDTFAQQAAKVGVDGVITVDMPPEEGEALVHALKSNDLDSIFLLAPTTAPERIKSICDIASGFVYYVSLKGVTGSASLNTMEVAERLSIIREYTDLPVGVGFGIRDADSARQVATVADAVVVGRAIVQRIAENLEDVGAAVKCVSEFVTELRQAIDSVK